MTYFRQLAGTAALLCAAFLPAAAQSNDADYTAKIRELTSTDPKWKFTSELVDHLPASSRVHDALASLVIASNGQHPWSVPAHRRRGERSR